MGKAKSLTVPELEQLLSGTSECIKALEALLFALEDGNLQNQACARLHELSALLDRQPTRMLKLHVVGVPGTDEPMRLILHPAVFSPEHWGRTFAEGLLKEPERFDGKRVVELGTGSGWISLLLLTRTRATEILGLDINQIAVLMARLNAWLNGTNPDGSYRFSNAGVPIPRAFRAAVSDLLDEPLSRNETFDHAIGCIPQVLHPDPSALGAKRRRLSNQDLYDLSNYCFQQGILEDRFGLPLISRALEQSQLCLRPGGEVTLVLGGRPGNAAIDGMFRRRGFEPSLAWSRRIQQADDTDLASLVELEKTYGIRFHFFMSLTSEQPVSASTVVSLLGAGRPVYHDLLVYQAQTRFEKATTEFVRNIHSMGLAALRRELDFSRITEEQVSFLDRFSGSLIKSRTLPYPNERGDLTLRSRLATFLNVYCHHDLEPEDLFVGPERAQLAGLILHMVASRGQAVLLSRALEPVYRPVCELVGLSVTVGNDDLSELLELEELIAPTVSLLAPSELEHSSPLVLDALCRRALSHPDRWYLVDDSAHFDISSNLGSNAFLGLIGQREVPSNLILVYGLIKNTVCPDLELSFLVNAPGEWLHQLEVGAELTYSRISYLAQAYYNWLFDDLLAFPFLEECKGERKRRSQQPAKVTQHFAAATGDPTFAPKPVSVETEGLIRLDYGEIESSVPDLLIKGAIKGLLEVPADGLPELVKDRVRSYVKVTRGVAVSSDRIVLAQGVFPLLGALLRMLEERLGRPLVVAIPQGSYGLVYPMVAYHGSACQEISTPAANGFLLNPADIATLSPKPDLLWITQPNNPSGLFFDPDSLRAIMRTCAEREIYVLSDEIFFLLSDLRLGEWTLPALSFAYFLDAAERRWLFLVDGLSKAFAAGGLRCGFMVCPDGQLARAIQNAVWMPPKSTLRAWDTLYSAFLEEAPHELMDLSAERRGIQKYLTDARTLLASQREALTRLLKENAVDDGLETHNRGGLFVLARLAHLRDELAREAKLLINSQEWSRTPGWSRICYGLTPDRFETAMTRLQAFLRA